MDKRIRELIAVGLLALCLVTPLNAAPDTGWQQQYLKRTFYWRGHTMPYRLLLPAHFDETKQYPLVVFLHGAGERGSDNTRQLINGGQLFVQQQSRFPAVVVFPQAPRDDYWAVVKADRSSLPYRFDYPYTGTNEVAPTSALQGVMALTDRLIEKRFIDNSRVYVAGLSMGGMGTLELLARQPDTFAAAIAICPGANPAIVNAYRESLSLRIYHGADDDIVVPALSAAVANAAQGKIHYIKRKVYPATNHNSWDKALSEEDFLSWLMAQSLHPSVVPERP